MSALKPEDENKRFWGGTKKDFKFIGKQKKNFDFGLPEGSYLVYFQRALRKIWNLKKANGYSVALKNLQFKKKSKSFHRINSYHLKRDEKLKFFLQKSNLIFLCQPIKVNN